MIHQTELFTQDLSSFPNQLDDPHTLSYLQSLESTLPLFTSLQSDDILTDLSLWVQKFQHFSDILILGTGGSSLGGQTILALRNPVDVKPQIHFIDNIDPYTFQNLLKSLSPSKTGVIAISKSGNTVETMMQLLVCLQYWIQHLSTSQMKDHFLILSELKENGIRKLASNFALPCLDHPHDIGGRFAVFTIVGLLPMLLAGMNAQSFRDGARSILAINLTATHSRDCPALLGALAHMEMRTKGVTQTIMMPYIDRLNTFTLWFRQLWAESLGKKDKNKHPQGITPVPALGTVDQHSQLQLFLDGPKDKLFTIITMNHDTDSLKISMPPLGHPAVDLLCHKTMGNLMEAEQQATIDTLRLHECPTRVIHLSRLDEEVLGGLMMHYMLETLAMAHLLDVNPFDQPAVEEGKILAQQYLSLAA